MSMVQEVFDKLGFISPLRKKETPAANVISDVANTTVSLNRAHVTSPSFEVDEWCSPLL